MRLTNKIDKRRKRNMEIVDFEKRLLGLKGKSVNLFNYQKYINVKSDIIRRTKAFYSNINFKKDRFYMYVERCRSEAMLINDIKRKYGANVSLFIGNWSEKTQRKFMISTPGKGLRRLLGKHFTLYMIDEYKTSCLHHITEQRCDNLRVTCNDNTIRKLHSVLTFTGENERRGCINRDKYACYNMCKIVQSCLRNLHIL